MANATELRALLPVRALIVGYPKAGKTGSLVSLLNAGFKLRVLDYDGNMDPLLLYANSDKLANLDVVSLEDNLKSGSHGAEPAESPHAFIDGFRMLDHWKYKKPDGTEVDLGPTKEWGPDTIMVLDGLTSLGKAAMRRSRKLMNKSFMDTTDRVWGFAMAEQEAFIEKATATSNRFHFLALSHLKMIGPADVRKGDTQLTERIKQEVSELLPTRLWPSALGRQLPQQIGGEFPSILLVERKMRQGRMKQLITTVSRNELDLGAPARDLPAELDISDGMLTIFKALSPGSVELVCKQGE